MYTESMSKKCKSYAFMIALGCVVASSASAELIGSVTPNCIVGEGTRMNGLQIGARCFSLAQLEGVGSGTASPAISALAAVRAYPSPADAWRPVVVPPPGMVFNRGRDPMERMVCKRGLGRCSDGTYAPFTGPNCSPACSRQMVTKAAIEMPREKSIFGGVVDYLLGSGRTAGGRSNGWSMDPNCAANGRGPC